MSNSTTSSQKIPKWMGPLCIIFGVIPVLVSKPAAGVPYWVAYLACSVFVIAGIIMTAQSFGITWVGQVLGPLIVLIFAIITSWIAFAPGERQCSGSISIPFLTKETTGNNCTIPFGIGAVLCWLFFIFGVYHTVKQWITRK